MAIHLIGRNICVFLQQSPAAYQPRESLIIQAERTSRHLNVEHYFIMGKSMESHHANWLLKFVPPYVNVCETGIHTHCLVEGHKTFFSNVVAGNRQSRRQKRYQISWTAWRTEIVLC